MKEYHIQNTTKVGNQERKIFKNFSKILKKFPKIFQNFKNFPKYLKNFPKIFQYFKKIFQKISKFFQKFSKFFKKFPKIFPKIFHIFKNFSKMFQNFSKIFINLIRRNSTELVEKSPVLVIMSLILQLRQIESFTIPILGSNRAKITLFMSYMRLYARLELKSVRSDQKIKVSKTYFRENDKFL